MSGCSSESSVERLANPKKTVLALFALDRDAKELRRLEKDARSIGVTIEKAYR